MKLKKIGVVGAGMMGAEIALCFAKSGLQTMLADVEQEIADRGKRKQGEILDKSIAKGKLPADQKETILGRVVPTGELSDLADCDLIVEAALESLEVKSEIFSRLDGVCKATTIFASNTSSISITKLAASVSRHRAARFLGTHFNSPASIMKLVELIPGLLTEEEAVTETEELLLQIEKEVVRVKDVVGFGLNRIFHCMYLEACRLVEEGVCSPQDVDKICKYGLGHPMGIFRLLDTTGHDLNLRVDQILFDAYGERFRPSPQIQRLVDAGRLGRKSCAGFFEYDENK